MSAVSRVFVICKVITLVQKTFINMLINEINNFSLFLIINKNEKRKIKMIFNV